MRVHEATYSRAQSNFDGKMKNQYEAIAFIASEGKPFAQLILLGDQTILLAKIRAKVEHPFRVIKCQFGHIQASHGAQLTCSRCTAHLGPHDVTEAD